MSMSSYHDDDDNDRISSDSNWTENAANSPTIPPD